MKTNILRFPGLPERIRARLRALGYWREDGKPDVLRFAREKGYTETYVYRWLDGVTPTYEYLVKLSNDLQVPVAELVFGTTPGSSPSKIKGSPQSRKAATTRGARRAGMRDYVKFVHAKLLPAA